MPPKVKQLYGRYFCYENPSHRVFPYDSWEASTVAPEPGKKGKPVLLTSYNGVRGAADKVAYCWTCKSWVPCVRRTQHEIAVMYLRREGVLTRAATPAQLIKRVAHKNVRPDTGRPLSLVGRSHAGARR